MYSSGPNLKTCLCLSSTLRMISSCSTVLAKNHYDSLGITPAATQSQVKSAYYKLSKVYHPDKNAGSEEASKKFREVSAAYEVLGNAGARRLYDKGLTGGGHDHSQHAHPRFYRTTEARTRPPPPDGRTPIYDFDEWSKQHYGATFARDMHLKERRRLRRDIQFKMERQKDNSNMMVMLLVLAGMVMYLVAKRDDYDRVEERRRDGGGKEG